MITSEHEDEDVWELDEFPALTTAFIPYTSSPTTRADPYVVITEAGWLFIEIGNVRLAVPDEQEWDKLVAMVTRMWRSWNPTPPPPPTGELEKEEDHDSDNAD